MSNFKSWGIPPQYNYKSIFSRTETLSLDRPKRTTNRKFKDSIEGVGRIQSWIWDQTYLIVISTSVDLRETWSSCEWT